ncbi:MAG: SRPBCC family protein [Anditalea sp.]
MAKVELQITIQAPVERVFDLARNIDLHVVSAAKTQEKVIGGKNTGLLELNDTVTWRARHLGIWQTLTSKMTEFDKPNFFTDQMLKGAFKSMKHEHYFKAEGQGTVMTDVLVFESPFGLVGEVVDRLFLTNYMANFIKERNAVVKRTAESGAWREFLE